MAGKVIKRVEVSAIPFTGYDGYCRAGRRWTAEPTIVEVVLGEPDSGQISEEQLRRLEDDLRIKVRSVRAAREESKAEAKTEAKSEAKAEAK